MPMRNARLLLLLAALALLTSCSGAGPLTLDAGTCFDDTALDALEEGGQVRAVDCSQPHDNQVVAVVQATAESARPMCEEVLPDHESFELLVVLLDDDETGSASHACVAFRSDFERNVGILPETAEHGDQETGGADD